jgi:hypothetical protein
MGANNLNAKMAAKPPYIKSRSDFIGPASARFCDARRGTMGMHPLLALFFSPAFGLRLQRSDKGDLMALRAV